MANILDYLHWRGDLSFEADKFNIIDGLIFTQIVYIDWEHTVTHYPNPSSVVYEDAVKNSLKETGGALKTLGVIVPKAIIELSHKAGHTKRFGKIKVSNYENYISKEEACQFAAMCFHVDENKIFISFRGTDDTLMGWQEDLDMVCKFPIPAQALAAEYVDKICQMYPKAQIAIGGHSKGGNLAMYAGIYCNDSYKSRIKWVFNVDGPGFIEGKIDLDRYELIKNKMINLLPQDSVFGLIFKQYGAKQVIIKSKNNGVLQHDAFNWQIKPTTFERAKEISKKALKLNESVDKLLANLTEEDRENMAKNIYDFFIETHKNTLTEAQKDWFTVLRKLTKINGKNRKLLMSIIYDFVRFRQI